MQGMITVDCTEVMTDEELALASSLSESLQGRALALVKGGEIVMDVFSGQTLALEDVKRFVTDFVSRRRTKAITP